MQVVITQSNYIPWKGYFEAIKIADAFVLYDDAQYTKRDWRNRNLIKTQTGTQWLTIPVEVKNKFTQKIKDTKVSSLNWTSEHWKSIANSYTKATYYKNYKDFFEDLYMQCTFEYLSEINYHFLFNICKLLNIDAKFHWSHNFELSGEKTEKLVGLSKKLNATDYFSGPAAKGYMDESLFAKENIKVHYFDYSGYPEYRQLHGNFVHEVSVIDLIFNEGSNSLNYFKNKTSI